MALTPIGYAHLIATYDLRARALKSLCCIDSGASQRRETMRAGQQLNLFEPSYHKGNTLIDHLEFALRYEGPNLEVLALLFANHGKAEIEAWLTSTPRGKYARMAGYLYEFLTGVSLDAPAVPPKTGYIELLDPERFITGKGHRNPRFGLIVNLLGNSDFCPTIRRTPFIAQQQAKNLKALTAQTLAKYDKTLLDRAAAFLYLKETHSSFRIEREKPSTSRAERFAALLAAAGDVVKLTKDALVELQNAVIDQRFAEAWFRHQQSWIGREVGSYYKHVDFVPPRPEDVELLVDGLLEFANNYIDNGAEGCDEVGIAACVAFGFVFIHPFMDGNGRLHRFLIHQMLSRLGFTPRGIILPVSAVMLANLNHYVEALEDFSKALAPLVAYDPHLEGSVATGNDALYYKYFDATAQVEFLYSALERTVTRDLEEEIRFLLHYDAAYAQLNAVFDWPRGRLDLFIQVLAENQGKLSARKRASHFDFLGDNEIAEFEATFAEAFELPG